MKPEQVHSLLEAYHDGTLNDADARKLASAIEAGDETSCLIMDEMEFSGLLSTALEDFDGEGFVRGLEEKFRAQTNAGAFTENFQERVRAANIGKPESIGRKTVVRGNLAGKGKSLTQQYLRESSRTHWGFRIAALAAALAVVAGGYWLFHNVDIPGHDLPPVSALAAVQTADGKVEMTRGVQRFPVTVGMQVCDGDILSVSAGSRADIRYAGEQTTVAIHAGTTAKFWLQNEAKRINLDDGTLVCQIAKQPEARPMRFITPHAEAVVLGTQLRLAVTNGTTQLEVMEGSVRLARNEQEFVMVNSGELAVVAKGVDLKAQVVKPGSPALTLPMGRANGPMSGATSYYAQWPNGISADPNFFPIWVWDQDPANVNDYKDAGINMYVGPCGITEADLGKLTAAGMKLICEQDPYTLKLAASSKTIVGWINYDLPDVVQMDGENVLKIAMKSSWIIDRYNAYRSKDSSRPVYLALSEGVVRDDYPARGARMNHPEDYREFVKGADLFGLHVMPMNEPQPPVRNNPWYVAKAADKLLALSGNTKPVWCAIECTKTSENSAAKPTPAQVKAEVWMGLIHGADGIGYLCYSRVPSFKRAAILKDKVMLAKVAEINRQIASLAPVLNSATVGDGATVNSSNTAIPIDLMVKKHAGATYIFAVAMRDGSTTATFTAPSGANVEVLGENRNLAISGGKFSDQFESYGVHLYKVSGTIATASKQ
jgi:hypothetical protein